MKTACRVPWFHQDDPLVPPNQERGVMCSSSLPINEHINIFNISVLVMMMIAITIIGCHHVKATKAQHEVLHRAAVGCPRIVGAMFDLAS